jgi:hypothetical protein
MEIKWQERVSTFQEGAVYAVVTLPSNIRPMGGEVVLAAYSKGENGLYNTSFKLAIKKHFNPPTTWLHTELGARRRIRKYLELWAIAGYPLGD